MKPSFPILVVCALTLLGEINAAELSIPAAQLDAARQARDSFEKGDYRSAERQYEQLVVALPENVYLLSNLGVVRFRVGKYQAAVDVLVRATKLAPNDTFSHQMLGIIYYTEGKHDDAVGALTRAFAIDPKNATAHRYLGLAAQAKGWTEAAKKELERADELERNQLSPQGVPERGDYPAPLEKDRLQEPPGK